MTPNFKKYLVRTFNRGAFLVSEIEIAEGSLAELRAEDRIVKAEELPIVQPEPIDVKFIEQCVPLHRELTEIAVKNGGIFLAQPSAYTPPKHGVFTTIKNLFRL